MSAIRKWSTCLIIFATVPAATLASQSTRPPAMTVRELSAPSATSAEHFASILSIRGLPEGKLLVNDQKRHQLVMLDGQMRRSKTVLDSVAVGGQSYGLYTPIIPYLGDSSLIIDGAAVSLVMINPDGTMGRVMAPPITGEWDNLSRQGTAHDARGGLIFRKPEKALSTATDDTAQLRKAFSHSDSVLVVRASFGSGRLDTLGRVRSPLGGPATIAVVNNRTIITIFEDPMPTFDDYAVLSDGSVAFVRGHDYHVDVIAPDGQRITGPKLAFDWKRLTDADKQGLIDSVNAKAARDAARAAASANRPGGAATGVVGGVAIARPQATDRRERVFESAKLTPEKIADYYPPIRAGAVKADMNANLWILPTTSAQSNSGELIYDVVNNRGEMMYRVRIPAGRSIAGFGKNGEVYLMFRDANGWILERTSVR